MQIVIKSQILPFSNFLGYRNRLQFYFHI